MVQNGAGPTSLTEKADPHVPPRFLRFSGHSSLTPLTVTVEVLRFRIIDSASKGPRSPTGPAVAPTHSPVLACSLALESQGSLLGTSSIPSPHLTNCYPRMGTDGMRGAGEWTRSQTCKAVYWTIGEIAAKELKRSLQVKDMAKSTPLCSQQQD